MVVVIYGASHTGKTKLAQSLLEKYKYPYLSVDHIKMGLIRSGQTELSPLSDDESLTLYLWPIIREIIKTAIENNQNLIIEGCYIPYDWKKDFSANYLSHIYDICLIFSKNYIKTNFRDIIKYANVIEERIDDSDYSIDSAIEDNGNVLKQCQVHNLPYVLIDTEYDVDISLPQIDFRL